MFKQHRANRTGESSVVLLCIMIAVIILYGDVVMFVCLRFIADVKLLMIPVIALVVQELATSNYNARRHAFLAEHFDAVFILLSFWIN